MKSALLSAILLLSIFAYGSTPSPGSDPVTLFPNPYESSLTVIVPSGLMAKQLKLVVRTEEGKEVLNMRIDNRGYMFQAKNLPPGVYTYDVVQNATIIQSGKLVSGTPTSCGEACSCSK